MTIRNDESHAIEMFNIENFNNRTDIRTFLLDQMASENPQIKYRYFIERLKDNSRIYLERPGRLNKGCDFVIYIENHYLWQNGNDRPPDHDFVLNNLRLKHNLLNDNEWNSLNTAIGDIYNCQSYANANQHISELREVDGHSYELLLKLVRWFFIEQDITYWSGSGREMFFNAINEISD